jgi:hypothetical protein
VAGEEETLALRPERNQGVGEELRPGRIAAKGPWQQKPNSR